MEFKFPDICQTIHRMTSQKAIKAHIRGYSDVLQFSPKSMLLILRLKLALDYYIVHVVSRLKLYNLLLQYNYIWCWNAYSLLLACARSSESVFQYHASSIWIPLRHHMDPIGAPFLLPPFYSRRRFWREYFPTAIISAIMAAII